MAKAMTRGRGFVSWLVQLTVAMGGNTVIADGLRLNLHTSLYTICIIPIYGYMIIHYTHIWSYDRAPYLALYLALNPVLSLPLTLAQSRVQCT